MPNISASGGIEVRGERVLLRDPLAGDVEARLRWSSVEVAWQDWDAPWNGKGLTPPEQIEEARRRLRERIAKPLPTPRTELWIERIGGPLLGWVSQYHYDPAVRTTWVGVNICESAYWGQGLGTEALGLWIAYLFAQLDLASVRTATWSGNVRMVRVAEKCGFVLVKTTAGAREVRGERYDALEFELDRRSWERGRCTRSTTPR